MKLYAYLINEGKQIKLRLYQIDTPELDQTYGERAKEILPIVTWDPFVRIENRSTDPDGQTVGLLAFFS